MEKPQFANQDIYDIMLNCWNAKPETRPLFNELEKRLGALMQDGVKDVSFISDRLISSELIFSFNS